MLTIAILSGCVATPERVMRDSGTGIPTGETLATSSGSPDLCAREVPTAGSPQTVSYGFVDVQFQTMPPPEPLTLQVFEGAPTSLGICDASTGCTEATTNADGVASLTLPENGWFTVKIVGTETIRQSIAPQLVAPPAGPSGSVFITNNLAMTSAAIVGRTPVDGATSLSGELVDCAGAPIGNAYLRLYRGDTLIEQSDAADGTFFAFYQGPLPALQTDTMRTTTVSGDGRFIAGNIPDGDGPLRLEAWGSVSDGAAPTRIACEEIPAEADSTTVISLGPLREDYAADSPCGS